MGLDIGRMASFASRRHLVAVDPFGPGLSDNKRERERHCREKNKEKKRAIREGGGGRVLCLVCARSVAMATDK